MLLLKVDQATGPGKKFPKHFLTCGIAGALSLAIIFGAFRESESIGTRLGMNIHGVMKMDFIGFTNIVDAVGGVDVDVPERLTDYSYPVQEGVIGTFKIDAGPQHLDGETALKYARSRHSTSDFSRSARQQQILAAIGDKVKSTKFISNMDAVHAVQVAVRDHFETTLGPTELFALGTTLASVPRDHIVSMNLNYASGGDYSDAEAGGFIRVPPEGTFTGAVLLPVSPTDEVADWSMIRFFSQLIFGRRDVYVRKPRVVIVQGDAAVREAHRLRNELVRYGFDAVHERGEASGTGTMITSVQTDDGAFFSSLLGMPLVQETSGTGTGIRIRLGENYEFTPLVSAEPR